MAFGRVMNFSRVHNDNALVMAWEISHTVKTLVQDNDYDLVSDALSFWHMHTIRREEGLGYRVHPSYAQFSPSVHFEPTMQSQVPPPRRMGNLFMGGICVRVKDISGDGPFLLLFMHPCILSEETGFLKLTRRSLLVLNSAWNKSQTTGQISSI